MSEPIMTLQGRGAVLELHDDRIVARRSGFMTFVIGKGNKEIAISQVKSVSIASEATTMSGGVLEVSTGSGLLGDYHLWFAKSQTPQVETFKKLLDEKIAARSATMAVPHAPSPSASVADELEKFAKLRDQGILTPAEFETKKKALLGL